MIKSHGTRIRFQELIPVLILQMVLAWGAIWWWWGDDPAVLKLAINHGYWDFFFSPASSRELTASNFTPLVFATFKLNFDLFGLSPAFFYLHQQLALCLALVLLYILCRRWLSPLGSLVTVMFFMLSRPALLSGEYLSQRHYVEGLIFGLGATLCFIKSMEERSSILILAAALLYLLAALSKEIYVALPAILVAVPVGKWKERLGRLWPMFLVIPIYALWRFWMLGGLGGYGLDWWTPRSILRSPSTVLNILGWKGWVSKLFILGVGAALLIGVKKEWKIFGVILGAMVLLPVIPVIELRAIRYAFLSSLVIALMVGLSFDAIAGTRKDSIRRYAAILLVLVVLGLQWWKDVVTWRTEQRCLFQQGRVEGEYVLSKGKGNEFIKDPYNAPVFFDGLGWLRLHLLGLCAGPRPMFDPICLIKEKEYEILSYNKQRKALVPEDYSEEMRRFEGSIRNERPLWLKIWYSEPVIMWEFGPWKKGRYSVIFEGYYQTYIDLPRQGKIPLKLPEAKTVRLKYVSAEGWVGYSPPLLLEPKSGATLLQWQR